MEMYEINGDTLCLIEIDNYNTKVIEKNEEFIVKENIHKIVDESCKSFGSSLEGRLSGTLKLTNIRYKAPIILSEYLDMILLPTGSRRGDKCHYISFNSIIDYDNLTEKEKNTTKHCKYKSYVFLNNNKKIYLEINKSVLKNQMNKCAMLKHYLELHNKREKSSF